MTPEVHHGGRGEVPSSAVSSGMTQAGSADTLACGSNTLQIDLPGYRHHPGPTFEILKSLTNGLHHTLVLTCAATALRSSEILALRWANILWEEGRIRVSKRWAKGKDGQTKTETSDGYVPLHPLLAHHLRQWQTPHKKDKDFVFPSFKAGGRIPLISSVFVADHLRSAAITECRLRTARVRTSSGRNALRNGPINAVVG